MKELLALTAHELMAKFAAGEVKPAEFCETQLGFAAQVEPKVKSFITLAEPGKSAAAAKVQSHKKGARKLSQIPVSVKDCIITRGFPTTAGSRVLAGYTPPYNATAVQHLLDAGNFLIGKTNLDEFAMGSSTENSAYHVTHNPWDLTRVPGGSSGGAAASVAALQSVVALGTDTGGSVRQPSGFCGVVGFLPSYGFVSRRGLIAFVSSLDQISVVARDVTDVALALNTIARPDPLDATSCAPLDADFLRMAEDRASVEECTIGVVRQLMGDEVDAEVRALCEESVRILERVGCTIKWVDLPMVDKLLACYYVLCPAEVSSNLARYDGVRYGAGFPADTTLGLQEQYRKVRTPGFGEEVKRRILLGTYVLSAGYAEQYYNQARRVRYAVAQAVAQRFQEVDFLLTPTSPTPAFKLGERIQDPVALYLSDLCTVLANLASIPAVSLPAWLSKAGLPVGVQLMAPRGEDGRLLAVARLYEEAAGMKYQMPPLIAEELAGFTG